MFDGLRYLQRIMRTKLDLVLTQSRIIVVNPRGLSSFSLGCLFVARKSPFLDGHLSMVVRLGRLLGNSTGKSFLCWVILRWDRMTHQNKFS